MNGVIPAANVKILGKSIQALARVGDELYMEMKKDTFSFITLNLSKTVCARFDFLDSFFSSYEVDENEFTEEDSDEKLTCKIHMKVLLPLFRGNLEKKLDFFKIEYENNADCIIMKMRYRQDDIMMVHKLRLMDSETMSIGISTDAGCNNICASNSFCNQLLTMFCSSDDEITFEVMKSKLIARNYCVGTPCRPKTIRSQVNLNPGEFIIYSIQEETVINFALKPFRTVVHFADGFNLNIGFNFETGGRPISMVMKNPTFNASFIIATINPNHDMQSTMTTSSIPNRIISQRKTNHNLNITAEDRQALETENWDDFNLEDHVVNGEARNVATRTIENSQPDRDTNACAANSKSRRTDPLKDRSEVNGGKKSSLLDTRTNSGNSILSEIVNEALDYLNNDMRLDDREGLVAVSEGVVERNGDAREGNGTCVLDGDEDIVDVIPESPESPRSKKARMVFGRCFEPTFHGTQFGDVLAPASDDDTD